MSRRFYPVSMLPRPSSDCLLLDMSNAKRKSKSIANSPDGVACVVAFTNKQEVAIQDVQVIMEPTGVYHERALFVPGPSRFGGVAGQSGAIAQIRARHWRQNQDRCRRQRRTLRVMVPPIIPAWQPPSASARELRVLFARRDAGGGRPATGTQSDGESGHSHRYAPERVKQSLNEAITFCRRNWPSCNVPLINISTTIRNYAGSGRCCTAFRCR